MRISFASVLGFLALCAPLAHQTKLVSSTLMPAGSALRADEFVAGDSLKYVISWKQASDSATKGKIDSTVYKIKSNKGITYYGSSGVVAANTVVRRRKLATEFADSFKLAKPTTVGDTANFQITGFTECRQGDCGVGASAGWLYKPSWAPPPTEPSIRVDSF
jgi:hypothetical protein